MSEVASEDQGPVSDGDPIRSLQDEIDGLKVRYRHLVECAPVGIYEVDFIDQRFVHFNDVILEYTGYTREEFQHLSPLDLLIEEDRPRFFERIMKAMAGEEVPTKVEYTAQARDGRQFNVELETRFIYKGGAIAGAHVVARDKTEIRRIEKALASTEKLYRSVVESAREVILIHQDGKILYSNGRMEELTGYTVEELNEMGIFNIIHPEDRGLVLQHYGKRQDGDSQPYRYEARYVTKGGILGWAEFSTTLIDHLGAPAILVIITETTSRTKANKELAHNLALQKILSGISSDFINIDVAEFDRALEMSMGKVAEFLGADRGYIFFLSDQGRSMDNTHEWCREGITPYKDELRDIPVDEFGWVLDNVRSGEVVTLENIDDLPQSAQKEKNEFAREGIRSLIMVPLVLGKELRGFAGFDYVNRPIGKDFSMDPSLHVLGQIIVNALARKEVQTEMIAQRSRAELYLDLLSHDIGNLHQGMKSWIDIGRSKKDDPKMLDLSLEECYNLIGRSINLVRNVLFLSRLPSKKPELVVMDLIPPLRESIDRTKAMYPGRILDIRTSIPDVKAYVMAEPLIEEVFQNILHNAVKFQMEDVPVVLVSVSLEGGSVRIDFKDKGPGIPHDIKENVFRSLREVQGKRHSGIGLAIVGELVRRYDGRVSIEDGDDGGTEFSVEFPLATK